MCVYWLESKNFYVESGETDEEKAEGNNGYSLSYWSDGNVIEPTDDQIEAMKQCITERSIKDRLLLAINLAFCICYGISLAIARAIGPCTNKDWSYLPAALSWTVAPIIVIICGRKDVIKDPALILGNSKIRVKKLSKTELGFKDAF
ncbi:43560_t:CDS:1, partial [Gigaspora margarita]